MYKHTKRQRYVHEGRCDVRWIKQRNHHKALKYQTHKRETKRANRKPNRGIINYKLNANNKNRVD